MSLISRYQYYRRVFRAYLVPGKSQLTFWHEPPRGEWNANGGGTGRVLHAVFREGGLPLALRCMGIPMLDYHGEIGLQYNPIAIAQWGLEITICCDGRTTSRTREEILAASGLVVYTN